MSLTSFLIALILLGIGLFLVCYFALVLFSPLLTHFGKGGKVFAFRKATRHLKKADELIAKKAYKKALKELKKALVLKLSNPKHLALLKEHQQNILSRALVIAEDHNARVSHIAEVEKLFLARAELQLLYLNAKASYSRIHSKRQEQGRSLPNWSVADFKKRKRDIEEELAKNQKELLLRLDSLFLEVTSGAGGARDDIVYH